LALVWKMKELAEAFKRLNRFKKVRKSWEELEQMEISGNLEVVWLVILSGNQEPRRVEISRMFWEKEQKCFLTSLQPYEDAYNKSTFTMRERMEELTWAGASRNVKSVRVRGSGGQRLFILPAPSAPQLSSLTPERQFAQRRGPPHATGSLIPDPSLRQ